MNFTSVNVYGHPNVSPMEISKKNLKLLLFGEETDRIFFREIKQSDFDEWLTFFKHKDSIKYIWPPNNFTENELCEKWMNRVFMRYYNDLGGMNALIDKATGKLVGQCGLLIQDVEGVNELEIGYSLMPAFRGKGYAIEAAKKCRNFAFENGLSDSLISTIHIENTASSNVAKKNGMEIVKSLVWAEMPVEIYKINKSKWLELQTLESK